MKPDGRNEVREELHDRFLPELHEFLDMAVRLLTGNFGYFAS